MNKAFRGNCLDVLKGLDDNSIDSVVTDPPYGLKFMGKKWDHDVPSKELWIEVLRVLKPGGYLLSFGGTRTYHRMAVNIEDAGFEIRDQIQWIYGCYSQDTECLTKRGWLNYTDIKSNDEILQWCKDSNELSWHKVGDSLVEYDFNGELVNLKNRHTDQLLTPNHRVYLKYKKHSRNVDSDSYSVLEASELKDHWIKDLPLAGKLMQGKSESLAYLIGWWLTDAWRHGDGKACMFSQSKIETRDKLRSYFDEIGVKYSEYVKEAKKDNHKNEHTFYVTGSHAEYLISNYPSRELGMEVLLWDYNSRYELLEGLLDGDGSRNSDQHAETFWSIKKDRLDIVQALCLSLNIRSHIDYKKGCVYLNRKTNTTQMQSKHKIVSKPYNNKVWCLKTEKGAFVVRREGRAFISGNSGFPKSHNISKAIDKKFGLVKSEKGFNVAGQGIGLNPNRKLRSDHPEYVKPKGITDLAKQWDGWGSALKPANEPIVLARKPLSEKTIVDNVLKWGTGGLNIDECRVELNGKRGNPARSDGSIKRTNGSTYGKHKDSESFDLTQGRFPANVIFDEEAGKVLDEQSGVLKSGARNSSSKKQSGVTYQTGGVSACNSSIGGASRFFYCAKSSKRERNEGLEIKNDHPTVKPIKLMQYLVKLVTPPGGVVLDPFMGSGTTCVAAKKLGFKYVGIERDLEYIKIARARIKNTKRGCHEVEAGA